MGNMGNGGWIMGEDITVYLYRCFLYILRVAVVKKNPVMSYPHSQSSTRLKQARTKRDRPAVPLAIDSLDAASQKPTNLAIPIRLCTLKPVGEYAMQFEVCTYNTSKSSFCDLPFA